MAWITCEYPLQFTLLDRPQHPTQHWHEHGRIYKLNSSHLSSLSVDYRVFHKMASPKAIVHFVLLPVRHLIFLWSQRLLGFYHPDPVHPRHHRWVRFHRIHCYNNLLTLSRQRLPRPNPLPLPPHPPIHLNRHPPPPHPHRHRHPNIPPPPHSINQPLYFLPSMASPRPHLHPPNNLRHHPHHPRNRHAHPIRSTNMSA